MSEEIKKTFKECILQNFWFKILGAASIILIFISFFLPPTGSVDPSVIAASGELMGWGALYTVVLAIEKNKGVEVKHNNTSITVKKQEEN